MNSTHVERDALGAVRAELVTAAGRRIAKRRSTRRRAVVLAVVALLLAATAATAALTHFSTGVPAVDELLDIDATEPHRPGPGSASEALPVRIGDGTTRRLPTSRATAASASPPRNVTGAAFAGASAAAHRWRT